MRWTLVAIFVATVMASAHPLRAQYTSQAKIARIYLGEKVLTAKDLSSDDRVRLEGFTAAVLVKKGQSPDALIREMRELIQRATGSGVSA